MEYAQLAMVWGGWCVLHSVLAARGLTDGLQRYAGAVYRRFYRLLYNGFSVVSLTGVILYTRQMTNEMIWAWTGGWQAVPFLFIGSAVVVFVLGLRRYDMGQFLGLAQLLGLSGRGIAAGGGIDTGGILSAVRHPWYLAILLLLWARDIRTADLVVNAVVTLYLVVGTKFEERKLLADFGDEYRAYQQQVSMLVPWKWLRGWIAERR